MTEIAQAERLILEYVSRRRKAAGAEVLKQISYRVPLTVAHGAYWSLIGGGKMTLEKGIVQLS